MQECGPASWVRRLPLDRPRVQEWHGSWPIPGQGQSLKTRSNLFNYFLVALIAYPSLPPIFDLSQSRCSSTTFLRQKEVNKKESGLCRPATNYKRSTSTCYLCLKNNYISPQSQLVQKQKYTTPSIIMVTPV